MVSEANDGENLAGSLMFLRRRRGAAVSTSGALSESEDLQQSEHCLCLSEEHITTIIIELPMSLLPQRFQFVNLTLQISTFSDQALSSEIISSSSLSAPCIFKYSPPVLQD